MDVYINDVLIPKALTYREVPMPNQTVLRTLANVNSDLGHNMSKTIRYSTTFGKANILDIQILHQ